MYDVARKWRCDGVRRLVAREKFWSSSCRIPRPSDRLAMAWFTGRPVWPSFKNQGGIQVPWWCNTQLISRIKVSQRKIITEDTSSQTDARGFMLGGLKGPPFHIRIYFVSIRSSDAIYALWLVQKTIAFVRRVWSFFPVAFLSLFAKICIFVQQLISKHDIRCSINCIIFFGIWHRTKSCSTFLPIFIDRNGFERVICGRMMFCVPCHKT